MYWKIQTFTRVDARRPKDRATHYAVEYNDDDTPTGRRLGPAYSKISAIGLINRANTGERL